MILRHHRLAAAPGVFRAMTGLTVAEFAALAAEVLPRYAAAERARLGRSVARRAIGGGRTFALPARDQLLPAVVWLRRYPTNDVLGSPSGVGEYVALRAAARAVPLLEASGLGTMRLPDPGWGRRPALDAPLSGTPGLAVPLDTFEQRVRRCTARAEAEAHDGGKKQRHARKSQVAVDALTGAIADVAASVRGPTHDLALLQGSGLLGRRPDGVGAFGDLADVGIAAAHPAGRDATPRRKPRSQPRPAADSADNRAFARRRVTVEHTIGRLRRHDALAQTDRHHRRRHTARVRAVAGLVNRQLRHRRAA